MIERADLPLRDILRFALPGLVAAGYAEAIAYLYFGRLILESAATPAFLMLALMFGLLSFAVEIHKLVPPWKTRWNGFVEQIREEMALALDDTLRKEEAAKPVYKMWLEASDLRPALRSYLQYSTGVFYSYATLTAWTALTAVASVPALWVSTDASPGFRFSISPIALVVTFFFGRQSFEALSDLRMDTMVALRSHSVREELRRIHTGDDESASADG